MERFKKGGGVSAADLNELAVRVEALAGRCRAAVAARRVLRVSAERMHFSFQLALRDGVLVWHRGYVLDAGLVPVAVGEEVWNEVEWDTGRDFDVWLDVRGGAVSCAPRSPSVASTRLRVRLGFGERTDDGGFRCVQVFGGVFNPYRPVMARGAVRRGNGVASARGGSVRDTDWQASFDPGRCPAGGVAQVDGYLIDPWGQKLRNDFFMYYMAGAWAACVNEREDGQGEVLRAVMLDNTFLHDRD